MAVASEAGLKNGDWLCPQCGDHQFKRNTACRKCGAENPAPLECAWCAKGECWDHGQAEKPQTPKVVFNDAHGGGAGGAFNMSMPGDWICSACGDMQFARNQACRKCGTPKSMSMGGKAVGKGGGGGKGGKGGGGKGGGGKEGCRWCAAGECWSHACGKGGGAVGGAIAGQQMRPGDWRCSQCNDIQFARNEACRKCGAPKSASIVGNGVAGFSPY